MKPDDPSKDTVIEGVLVPVRWSVDGEVSQVALMTFDEAEYRIDERAAEHHDLNACLRKHVRVVGRARGTRVTRITTLEVLEDERRTARRPQRREEF